MTIGDMVQRLKDRTPSPNPDGGIGGLTPAEEVELSDLINGPHTICECNDAGCGAPFIEPRHRRVE